MTLHLTERQDTADMHLCIDLDGRIKLWRHNPHYLWLDPGTGQWTRRTGNHKEWYAHFFTAEAFLAEFDISGPLPAPGTCTPVLVTRYIGDRLT